MSDRGRPRGTTVHIPQGFHHDKTFAMMDADDDDSEHGYNDDRDRDGDSDRDGDGDGDDSDYDDDYANHQNHCDGTGTVGSYESLASAYWGRRPF